jgi:hypothetical protein
MNIPMIKFIIATAYVLMMNEFTFAKEIYADNELISYVISGKNRRSGDIIFRFKEDGSLILNDGYIELSGRWNTTDNMLCNKTSNQSSYSCKQLIVDENQHVYHIRHDSIKNVYEKIQLLNYGISEEDFLEAVDEVRGERLSRDINLTEQQRTYMTNKRSEYKSNKEYKKECAPTTFIDYMQSLNNLMKDIPPQHVKNDCRDLVNSYRDYIKIRKCYDERVGQQSVFITDIEMENSKRNIHSIEKIIKNKSPYIDTDWVWSRADESIPVNNYFEMDLDLYRSTKYQESEYEIKRKVCDIYLSSLKDKLYKMAPSEFKTKKDF